MVTFERISRILPVPDSQDLLEKAFRRAKKKEKEAAKIDSFAHSITYDLNDIVRAFPSIDRLPVFYRDLVEYNIGSVELKKALANLDWASKKISQIMKKEKNARAVFGRVSSIVKKLSTHLRFLDNARRQFDKFPVIKDMFTVCITGFPNVGKTTLLSLITKSLPEIKPYPFTTKRINIGYLTDRSVEVQFLDTPGTLNRLNKMNNIELQSFLAMRDLADVIILVVDPTSDVKKQIRLFVRITSFKKPVVIFMSKTNLLSDSEKQEVLNRIRNSLRELNKRYEDKELKIKGQDETGENIITDKELLKKSLFELASSYYHNLLEGN